MGNSTQLRHGVQSFPLQKIILRIKPYTSPNPNPNPNGLNTNPMSRDVSQSQIFLEPFSWINRIFINKRCAKSKTLLNRNKQLKKTKKKIKQQQQQLKKTKNRQTTKNAAWIIWPDLGHEYEHRFGRTSTLCHRPRHI